MEENKTITVIKKMIEDKKFIQQYIQGKIEFSELTKRGIKFVSPLSIK